MTRSLRHRWHPHSAVSTPLTRRSFLSCTAVAGAVALLSLPAQAAFKSDGMMMPGSVPPRAGVTQWSTLAQVDFREFRAPVEVGPEPAALEGETITLDGYPMPFDDADASKKFLLTAYNAHCPYCMPGGMASIGHVYADKAVDMTQNKLMTLTGRLMIDRANREGFIYALIDAKAI